MLYGWKLDFEPGKNSNLQTSSNLFYFLPESVLKADKKHILVAKTTINSLFTLYFQSSLKKDFLGAKFTNSLLKNVSFNFKSTQFKGKNMTKIYPSFNLLTFLS